MEGKKGTDIVWYRPHTHYSHILWASLLGKLRDIRSIHSHTIVDIWTLIEWLYGSWTIYYYHSKKIVMILISIQSFWLFFTYLLSEDAIFSWFAFHIMIIVIRYTNIINFDLHHHIFIQINHASIIVMTFIGIMIGKAHIKVK